MQMPDIMKYGANGKHPLRHIMWVHPHYLRGGGGNLSKLAKSGRGREIFCKNGGLAKEGNQQIGGHLIFLLPWVKS